MHETAKIIAKSQNQYPDFSRVEFIIGTIITTTPSPLKPKLSQRLGFSQVFSGRVKSPLIQRFGLVPQWVRTLSTHAIASQAQSRCLNGNLTRLDSAATPRAVFLNLFWDSRFKITAKRASLVLRVEFGDRRIGKANRRKGQRPFLKTSETSKASFCLGASN